MRKNVIRLLVAMALVVSGSLMPVYAANNPMPMPPLPPLTCN
jgi:predicted histidine transporter YuiF (NhaC family)